MVTTLRLANLMGAGVDSHVTRYLSMPVVPRVMGFDARLQFLHPSDAIEALLLVTRDDVPGTFNVAALRHRHADPGAAHTGPARASASCSRLAPLVAAWSGRPG